MLRDSALKFYRDQAYVIPHKPIENGQGMNKNGHFENSRNSGWRPPRETTCFISETVSDRAKHSSTPVGLLITKLQLLKI